ncbi:MAG: DUF3179 domain-containing protein [Chloroflexota bacterium]|jgi:hypothetical protein
MNRIAIGAAIAALGLAAAVTITTIPTAVPVNAQEESPGEFVPLRPGQIEDPGVPRFSTSGWSTNFDISAVPFGEIFSGGPGKDGIPAIDDPRFESIEEARSWVTGLGPVIALEIDGDARAYPLAVLTWHEIVNDTVGGKPVIVTFCPLCHTALVFERTLDGMVHDFGVSGNLRLSDMVMYDRQTETWWQQATGKGIVGDLTGAKLEFVPSQLIGLDQFAEAYPEGVVLSRDTGFDRDYGRNPYVGYDVVDQPPFLFDGVTDGRLAPKERVVTLGEQDSDAPVSVPYSELRTVGVANLEFEGAPVAVFWQPGAASALDAQYVDESEDVGATGAFSAVVDGQQLTFARDGGEDAPITDMQTGSTWDVTGRAIDGPLAGQTLSPVGHGDHFWFAWAAFVPQTSIWTADGLISLDGGE